MKAEYINAIRFFQEHAGHVVNHRMKGAKSLALAEKHADDAGWETEWVHDGDADLSWADAQTMRKIEQGTYEVLGAILKDQNGAILASLWGIVMHVDDHDYRRVLAAALAQEGMQIPRCDKCGQVLHIRGNMVVNTRLISGHAKVYGDAVIRGDMVMMHLT